LRRKNLNRFSIVVTLIIFGSLAVFAQAKEPPSPRMQAASELVEAMELNKSIPTVLDGIIKAQLKASPDLVVFEDIYRQFYAKYMSPERLTPEIAKIYAGQFTEAELRELIAFYKAPAGHKFITLMPELQRQSMELGMRLFGDHIKELQEMIEKRIKELKPPSPPQDPSEKTPEKPASKTQKKTSAR